MEGNAIAVAECTDKGFVPVGFFSTKVMVKVGGFQGNVQFLF